MKKNGALGNLKAQLRTQFLSELKTMAIAGGRKGPLEATVRSAAHQDLRTRTLNALFAEHLKTMGYRYSLSVFVPECGMNATPALSKDDMLSIMNIRPGHALHSHLTQRGGREDTAPSLIADIIGGLESRATSHDAICQTDGGSSPNERLLQRLGEVDHAFAQRKSKSLTLNVEDRLVAYQKRCDAFSREEIAKEVARLKSVEIERMKMDERAEYQARLENEMLRLREEHDRQIKALMERKNAIEDSMKRREMELEKTNYEHRQRMLKEIELNRLREEELKRIAEVDNRALDVSKQKLEDMEKALQRDRSTFEIERLEWSRRCEADIAQFKSDIKRQYKNREDDIEAKERLLKQERSRFSKEQTEGLAVISEAQASVNELAAMRQRDAKHSETTTKLQIDLQTANEHLKIVSDTLKGDRDTHRKTSTLNDELRRQVSQLQQDLVDSRNQAHKRQQEQEDLIRALGEKLADEQTKSSHLRRGHAEEVRALRTEPEKQIATFKETIKWMTEEAKQQKNLMGNRISTLENELLSVKQSLEDAESTLHIKTNENAELHEMLQSARSTLMEVKDERAAALKTASDRADTSAPHGQDTDVLLASLRRRREKPEAQMPLAPYFYPPPPQWQMQMFQAPTQQAQQNAAPPPDSSPAKDTAKKQLEETLEREREMQRREMEMLKAEHALKLKEQQLSSEIAVRQSQAALDEMASLKSNIRYSEHATEHATPISSRIIKNGNLDNVPFSSHQHNQLSPHHHESGSSGNRNLPALAKESPTPAKESPTPAKESPTPAKQSPTPAKQSPTPAKQSDGSTHKKTSTATSRHNSPTLTKPHQTSPDQEKERKRLAMEQKKRMDELREAEKQALQEKREAREKARKEAEELEALQRAEEDREMAEMAALEAAEKEAAEKAAAAEKEAALERARQEEEDRKRAKAEEEKRQRDLEEEKQRKAEEDAEATRKKAEDEKKKMEAAAGFSVIQQKREEVKKRKEEAEARRSRDEAIKKQSAPSPVSGNEFDGDSYGDDSWGSLPMEGDDSMKKRSKNASIDNMSAIGAMDDEEIDEEDMEVHEVESDSGEDFFI
jgi:oral-facial-digital syndrome 1 protein